MPYRVTIADNFHYMGADEHVDGGVFDTYEDALARAKTIVDESLWSNWEQGDTPDALMARYTQFGDDPFITPAEQPLFSARDHARTRVESICRERAGWLPGRLMP
jgi:hypothetical protein